MEYCAGNTLASFRNICKEEIALDGYWRVAIAETIFQRNQTILLIKILHISERPRS